MSVLRVAFPMLGGGAWMGGYNYLQNTLRLINSRLAEAIEPYVFLSPEQAAQSGEELGALTGGRLIVDPAAGAAGRGSSLLRAMASGTDQNLERLLVSAGINVAFESASFYGARFAIPVVSWLPDFQHRHMPHMFRVSNRLRRDLGFRMQVGSNRTIMVSSVTAQRDLESFYPRSKSKSHVVRFAIDLDIAPHIARAAQVRATYALPERFFYLPNQFWQHKDHATVVAALKALKTQGALDSVPPIVLTGQTKDLRNPRHFDDLMASVRAAGVETHFRYLGLVPYADVLALNAACERMINPSLFEGWSTPIEEAKAFGTPLILSDLAIHREQAPASLFFTPQSAIALADALLLCARNKSEPRPPPSMLQSAQDERLAEHASALLAVIKAAAATRAPLERVN